MEPNIGSVNKAKNPYLDRPYNVKTYYSAK